MYILCLLFSVLCLCAASHDIDSQYCFANTKYVRVIQGPFTLLPHGQNMEILREMRNDITDIMIKGTHIWKGSVHRNQFHGDRKDTTYMGVVSVSSPNPWASDSKETLLNAIYFQRIMAERKIVDSHFHIFDLEARNSFPNQNPSHGFPSDQQPEINRSFQNIFPRSL